MSLQTFPNLATPQQALARRTMVDGQIRTFDVTDRDVIDQFYDVPRECFVDENQATLAYSDGSLTLNGSHRQLLAPMVLARLLEAAQIQPGDRVLDVGGGYGYSAAIMAGLAAHVVALESITAVSQIAKAALNKAKISNVECVLGPLVEGFAAGGPYDVILLNGAFAAEPTGLLAQLAGRGRLLAIRQNSEGSGQALLLQNDESKIGERVLFSSHAKLLEGFEAKPSFIF